MLTRWLTQSGTSSEDGRAIREPSPPYHSITSSTRASSAGGTARPSARAVLRLTISSTLVSCYLERQGKIVGDRVILAKVGIGLFVRRGAPKPNISSADALKSSLLAVTIVYTDPAAGAPGGIYVAKLLDQLGIGAAMKPKTKLTRGGEANLNAVVDGEAEIGFNMINEILSDPRVRTCWTASPDRSKLHHFCGWDCRHEHAARRRTGVDRLSFVSRYTCGDEKARLRAGLT